MVKHTWPWHLELLPVLALQAAWIPWEFILRCVDGNLQLNLCRSWDSHFHTALHGVCAISTDPQPACMRWVSYSPGSLHNSMQTYLSFAASTNRKCLVTCAGTQRGPGSRFVQSKNILCHWRGSESSGIHTGQELKFVQNISSLATHVNGKFFSCSEKCRKPCHAQAPNFLRPFSPRAHRTLLPSGSNPRRKISAHGNWLQQISHHPVNLSSSKKHNSAQTFKDQFWQCVFSSCL